VAKGKLNGCQHQHLSCLEACGSSGSHRGLRARGFSASKERVERHLCPPQAASRKTASMKSNLGQRKTEGSSENGFRIFQAPKGCPLVGRVINYWIVCVQDCRTEERRKKTDESTTCTERRPKGTHPGSPAGAGWAGWSHRPKQPFVRGSRAVSVSSRNPVAGPARMLRRFSRRAYPFLALE
jgi:hypothetical protein